MEYRIERRRGPRLARRETVFVQVRVGARGATRRLVRSTSADLSGNGLRAEVDAEFSVGTAVELRVHLAALERRYTLRGQVRWCDPARRAAGFAIVFAADSDYWEWQATALE